MVCSILGCNKGDMGPNKSDPQPEWLIHGFIFAEQFDRFGCSFAIRVNQIISVRFDHNKSITSNDRSFPVWVFLESFSIAGCTPFRSFTVVFFIP